MKFKEINAMSVDELKKQLVETRSELFQSKLKHAVGQLGNPMEIRTKRKTVAKIQTALNQKLAQ